MDKYQEIYALRKTDKDKAYEMAVSYHKKNPRDNYISVAYAWTLYDQVKKKIAEKVDYKDVSMYIDAYLDLALERPSMVHSQFLYLFEKLHSDYRFSIRKVLDGYDNFDENDWKSYIWQGKKVYGIAYRITVLWAKSFTGRGRNENVFEVLAEIETAFKKGEYKVELNQLYVKLLLLARCYNEAETFWVSYMQNEGRTENYKDWLTLADIYDLKNEDVKAMSCYCKALSFPIDEKYLSKTKTLFGQLLYRLGKYDEAKTEIIKSKEIRESNIPMYQTSFVYSDKYKWFKEANEKTDNISFYHENKGLAESIVYTAE
ncbi:DUF7017 domain-containing protein [uncultured Bacteroides sp.]|uniref:DUF7017 domain-containing protein n=1 Tax=uncultured Bacteroides sp. TaxID=162156 RepID=UPI002AAAABCC|nr:hypothetical protein [uncultured Bacteroides sp.]